MCKCFWDMCIHFHRNIIKYRNLVISKGIINTEMNNIVSNKDIGKKSWAIIKYEI